MVQPLRAWFRLLGLFSSILTRFQQGKAGDRAFNGAVLAYTGFLCGPVAAVTAGAYMGGRVQRGRLLWPFLSVRWQHETHKKSALVRGAVRCPMLLIIFRFDFLGISQCKFYTFKKTYIGEICADFLKG